MKQTQTTMKYLTAASVLALIPAVASAHPGHPGHVGQGSFGAGFAHPLLGVDHLLALLAVGLLSARAGGRTLRLLPALFIGAMAAGAVAGAARMALPFVEQGIALSVLCFGLVLAAAWRPALNIAAPAVAFFALFHGFAHGAEMPAGAAALAYGAGFMAASITVLASGAALGAASDRFANREAGLRIPRAAGAVMSIAGVALLLV